MINDLFQTSLPESLLALGLILFPLFEIFKSTSQKLATFVWSIMVTLALGACFYLLSTMKGAELCQAYSGHFLVSADLLKIKIIFLLLTLPLGLLGEKYFMNPHKYYLLLLSSVYGGMLLISAGTFLTLFMGLELMNIPLYALILNGPKKSKAYEASMKYLFIDGIVTASFLMGLALLYYGTGSIALSQWVSNQGSLTVHAQFGYFVVFLSLLTKLTVAPFHFWGPDVNEGSSLRIVYVLSILTKFALLFVLWKVTFGMFNELRGQGLLIGLSLISIFWGNIAAYKQQSIKRFLAYSSVAQIGYLLLVFLLPQNEQMNLTLLYFALYAPVLLLFIWGVEKICGTNDLLQNLEAQGRAKVLLSLPLLIGLLSFAGVPPFPGFFAKLAVMFSVIKAGYPVVAVLAFIGSYFGIYAYFRLIVSLYLNSQPFQKTCKN